MTSKIICLLPILLACTRLSLASGLDVIYEWKFIDYVWDSEDQREKSINDGEYDFQKIITNDVQLISGGRVLVTTPKHYDNPASLSVVSSESGPGGPLLKPYPNWAWHTAKDCSGIISVNRLTVDACGRLWFVDSGKIGNKRVCQPQLLAFNTETDELIQRIPIPIEISHSPSDETKGEIEIQKVETSADSCDTLWAYMGDIEGYGLLIWNGEMMWRLDNGPFAPDDGQSVFTIGNETVTLPYGTSSVLLPPAGFVKEDYLLWKPMASVKGYATTRQQLHNSHTDKNLQYYRCNYTIPSQELARDYSSKGVLIAGFPTETALACWNLQYPLESAYVVVLTQDTEKLQFISGLKITKGVQNDSEGEHVWVMSNRLQKFILGTMDYDDVNFRILGALIDDLVNGTMCDPLAQVDIVDTIEDKFFLKFDYEN